MQEWKLAAGLDQPWNLTAGCTLGMHRGLGSSGKQGNGVTEQTGWMKKRKGNWPHAWSKGGLDGDGRLVSMRQFFSLLPSERSRTRPLLCFEPGLSLPCMASGGCGKGGDMGRRRKKKERRKAFWPNRVADNANQIAQGKAKVMARRYYCHQAMGIAASMVHLEGMLMLFWLHDKLPFFPLTQKHFSPLAFALPLCHSL